MSHIRDIALLARMQTGALTAIVVVFGYLLSRGMGADGILLVRNLLDVLILLLVGLLIHIFGFVHNEYMDREYDMRSGTHGNKPLVSGNVGLGTARFIILFSIVSSVAVLGFVFGEHAATFLLAMAIMCGAVYNIYGKRIPGMDAFLAAWAFLYFLAGARTGGPLHPEQWVFALLAGLQIFFNNGIEGGMKDAVTDEKAGARTMAVVMGVSGSASGLRIPLSFKCVGWILKLSFLGGVGYLLFFSSETGFTFETQRLITGSLVIILACVMLFCQWIFFERGLSRERMLGIFAVHEISSVCLILALAVPILGIWMVMGLMAVPILWLMAMNRVLYGTTIIPRV